MPDFLAYIDPGAGSIFIQALIGGVLAALYAVKLYWHRLKSAFASMAKRLKRHRD